MWLIGEMKSFGGWAFSISRKILTTAPIMMTLVVLTTLVSQILRMLAYLLPIKIILLLSSPGIPRYFPSFFMDFERNELVVWLGIATIGLYLTHIAADKVVDRLTGMTADRVLTRSDKLALFRNQDSVARTACRNLAATIAESIFVALAVGLIAFVHAPVAALLVAWALVWFTAAAIAGAYSPRFRTWLGGNASKYAGTAATTGIFAVTALIITEIILGTDVQILYAIVAIILSRRAVGRISKLVSNAMKLSSRRLLINALFFRGQIWQGNAVLRHRSVWDLLARNERADWLPGVLEEASGRTVKAADLVGWYQTGLADILAVEVAATHGDGDEALYFVKLYGRGKDLGASHEAALQTACGPDRLPAPHFLGKFDVEDFVCLVHRRLTATPLESDDRSEVRQAAFAECWAVKLPADLVNRFKRSHQLLPLRLKQADLDRLALVAFLPEQQRRVEQFREILDPLCEWIGNRPLVLCNPNLNMGSLFVDADDKPVITEWGRWAIEPIGAGWPTGSEDLEALPDWLRVAQQRRRDLEKVAVHEVQIVAELFAFEKAFRKQDMQRAMTSMTRVMAQIEQHGLLGETAAQAEAPAATPTPPTVRADNARRLAKIAP